MDDFKSISIVMYCETVLLVSQQYFLNSKWKIKNEQPMM